MNDTSIYTQCNWLVKTNDIKAIKVWLKIELNCVKAFFLFTDGWKETRAVNFRSFTKISSVRDIPPLKQPDYGP